jgi:hypothetical protein
VFPVRGARANLTQGGGTAGRTAHTTRIWWTQGEMQGGMHHEMQSGMHGGMQGVMQGGTHDAIQGGVQRMQSEMLGKNKGNPLQLIIYNEPKISKHQPTRETNMHMVSAAFAGTARMRVQLNGGMHCGMQDTRWSARWNGMNDRMQWNAGWIAGRWTAGRRVAVDNQESTCEQRLRISNYPSPRSRPHYFQYNAALLA